MKALNSVDMNMFINRLGVYPASYHPAESAAFTGTEAVKCEGREGIGAPPE